MATTRLVKNALQLAGKCGLSWYLSDETTQQGNDFGENLVTAIVGIFKQGHEKVIVIGNDCPGLTQKKLQAAIIELQQHDWVLGPTCKGGVYLMGVSAGTFNETAFNEISWQSASVFSQLSTNISDHGSRAAYLDKLDDVNSEADVVTFYKNLKSFNTLIVFLINLYVSGLFKYNLCEIKIVYAHKLKLSRRRGPPLYQNLSAV